MGVEDHGGAGYWAREVGRSEDVEPPVEVRWGIARWGVWAERISTEGAEKALQTGEVGPTFRDDQGGVKQFSIELLSLL